MQANGSGRRTLDPDGEYPAWSPTGRQIAFNINQYGPAFVNRIFVINADGSGKRFVAEGLGPAWSPNGTKLVFSHREPDAPGNAIYVVNPDGTGQTRLSSPTTNDLGPDWSPDGRAIAFERQGEIYVMNADGSAQTRLTTTAARDKGPIWSPDGRRIAFTSERDGNNEVYVMNADGSGQTRITRTPSSDVVDSWQSTINLALAASPRARVARAGARVTFAATVRNQSPAPASAVRLTVRFAGPAVVIAVRPSRGTCRRAKTVSCTIPTIAPRSSARVSITIKTTGTGRITGRASVVGAQADPALSNNLARVRATVRG